jgi:hypothetical protein
MRVLVLAGLISAATVPFAAAAESDAECQLDDTRRANAEQRLDPTPAPATTVARPTVAQREAGDAPRVAPAERRRNGKRVPDAGLISPRGVL